MRELVSENRECGVSFLEEFRSERLARAPRVRSGLAHAAGFAGVFYLFGHSLAPLALSRWWATSGAYAWLVLAPGLLAPLALALAFAAGVSLDRSRVKAGALPALFGLVVGLLGTVDLLLVLNPWLEYLKPF
jgi:hypothetical protein